MYIVRFSYDFLPVNRRQAMELIAREVEAALANGVAERVFLAVAGIVALLAIGIAIGLSRIGERGRREASERWKSQMARWQQSWYCYRCHTTFVAGSPKTVAPEQFEQLLTTT